MESPQQILKEKHLNKFLLWLMQQVRDNEIEPENAVAKYSRAKSNIKPPLGKLEEASKDKILLKIMKRLQTKPDMTPEEAVKIYDRTKSAFGDREKKPHHHHHHHKKEVVVLPPRKDLGFTEIEKDPAIIESIKLQDFYYNKLDQDIANAIKNSKTGKPIPILHIPSRTASFHKGIKAFRDNFGYEKITIPYLIEKLNAAYENGDIKKVESYLRQLGLDEKRIRLTIKNLVSLNAKEKSAQTTTTPSLIKQTPK